MSVLDSLYFAYAHNRVTTSIHRCVMNENDADRYRHIRCTQSCPCFPSRAGQNYCARVGRLHPSWPWNIEFGFITLSEMHLIVVFLWFNAIFQHNIGYTWWPVLIVEAEPGKTPERTTNPQEATGKLSHITTFYRILDSNTRRGEMAVVRNGLILL